MTEFFTQKKPKNGKQKDFHLKKLKIIIMNFNKLIGLLLLVPLFFISCTSSENTNPGTSVPLENTRWKLNTLNGKKIFTPESGKDIFIRFSSADKRANGFAGCNTFFGTYKSDKNKIAIGPLASTEMFCEAMMQTETEFFKALSTTIKFKIKGNYLQLYDSAKMLAKFEMITGTE